MEYSRQQYETQPKSSLVQWVVGTGLVRTERAATILIYATLLVLTIITILYHQTSSPNVDYDALQKQMETGIRSKQPPKI